ncbi:extradiol ring-cleavage dioxygenase [Fredinandcohnia humi]
MTLVFSCITPHGGEIIPELCGALPQRMAKTRESMDRLGEYMRLAAPEAIIVLTPHGTRINGQFSISNSEHMTGNVEENGAIFSMARVVDRDLASEIELYTKQAGLPVGSINYATSAGPLSSLPLDWGSIVPLRFMPDVPVVIITPSRDISFEKHLQFGNVLRTAVQQSNKRVGLIASCDWAHAHKPDGPYGYHPAAMELDQRVVNLFKNNQLEDMVNFDSQFIEDAKPDGIWQTLILAGAIPKLERRIEFLSYEAPTYFGLLCAAIR